MRAEIRSISSPDAPDLSAWEPEEALFALPVRLLIGPAGSAGEESFDITVCSTDWIKWRVREDGIVDGRHLLIVQNYDWEVIRQHLTRRIQAISADDWGGLAAKLSRWAYWEFEDYSAG